MKGGRTKARNFEWTLLHTTKKFQLWSHFFAGICRPDKGMLVFCLRCCIFGVDFAFIGHAAA